MWEYGGLNKYRKRKGSRKESQKGDMIPDGPCDGSQRESKKVRVSHYFATTTKVEYTEDGAIWED